MKSKGSRIILLIGGILFILMSLNHLNSIIGLIFLVGGGITALAAGSELWKCDASKSSTDGSAI